MEANCKGIEISRLHTGLIIIIAIIVLLALTAIAPCVKRRRKHRKPLQMPENLELETLIKGVHFSQGKLGPREQYLGGGQYGKVYLRNWITSSETAKVACKEVTSEEASDDDLFAEARLMSDLTHRHIVNLLSCAKEGPLFLIVMEYMPNGSLLNYLQNGRPTQEEGELSFQELVRFSREAASGMVYLHSHHIIHRDLAARNCLLDEELSLRITDFGLSRRLEGYSQGYMAQHERALPVFGMPIEVLLYGEPFTTMGDAWSYGVLLWEIFSLGSTPYMGMMFKELVAYLNSGRRLAKPSMCTDRIYDEVMHRCWMANPEERPTLPEIYAFMIKEQTDN